MISPTRSLDETIQSDIKTIRDKVILLFYNSMLDNIVDKWVSVIEENIGKPKSDYCDKNIHVLDVESLLEEKSLISCKDISTSIGRYFKYSGFMSFSYLLFIQHT